MANSVVQTIRDAEVDARSLSEFVSKDASFTVTRRLAPTIHTLDHYLNIFDVATNNIDDQLLLAKQRADATVSYIEQTVSNAIDNTVIENSPVSDALVSVDGSLSQRTINKGLESIADLSTINNPKDGLRVYVKSYHAGLGKGGGYFTYDSSKSGVNDGGAVINGWVRDNTNDISVLDFGAKGDGAADDSPSIVGGDNLYTPSGDYVVDDSVSTAGLYGLGVLSKPSGKYNVPTLPQFRGTPYFRADMPFTSQNQMGVVVKNDLLFVVNSGRRDGSTQGTLDIFDVSARNKITRVSSLNIGDVSDQPRSLVVKAGLAYIRDFFGSKLYIVDVSNAHSPILVKTHTMSTGVNTSRAHLAGDYIIYPTQAASIEIYTIRRALSPEYVSTVNLSGTIFDIAIDGETIWAPVHNGGDSTNLYKISVSDFYKPEVVDSFTIPTMLYTRDIAVKDGYLYAGGYDSTSRLCVYDIKSGTPVLKYRDSELKGSRLLVLGNLLISDQSVLDITNPEEPTFLSEMSARFLAMRPIGTKIIGWGDISEGGHQGAPNDGAVGVYPIGLDLTGFYMPSGEFGELRSKSISSESLGVSNNITASGVSVGSAGVGSKGIVSGKSLVSSGGVIQRGSYNSTATNSIKGDISQPTPIFRIYGGRAVHIRIRYTAMSSISNYAATYTFGEFAGAGIFSGSGAWGMNMPFVQYGEPVYRLTKHEVEFTVTQIEGEDYATINVSCPTITESNSGMHVGIDVESFGALNFDQVRVEPIG